MSQLDKIVDEINKKKKYKIINKGIIDRNYPKIPFTSERLNYMTYGGIPRGCITEFAGIESSGKTTTALDIVKNAQIIFQQEWEKLVEEEKNEARKQYLIEKGAQKVIYADCENTLDENWSRLLGVDIDNLIILSPQEESAEELFDAFIEMLETGEVGLLVIDSLGVMVSAQAYEKSIEQRTYGGIAMALTTFSKKAIMLCQKYKTTIIGINQVREDLNSMYGGLITVGGKGWRHSCSLRLMFNKGKYYDEKNNELTNSKAINPIGNIVDCAIEKTKTCRPDRRRGFYYLNYTEGIDYVMDLIEIGLMNQTITQKGAYYYFYDEQGNIVRYNEDDLVFQGRDKLYRYLKENSGLSEKLKTLYSSLYKR